MFGNKGVAIATVGDEHCGSSVGLMPPGRWKLEEGGDFHPSPAQNWLWDNGWVEGWKRFKEASKGRKRIIVKMGDSIEGVHHQTLEIVTSNTLEQARINIECWDWVHKFLGGWDALYCVRGTKTHVDRGEELIARDLGAVSKYDNPGEDGSHVWQQLFLKVDYGNEPLLDFAHHGAGVGRRAWTRGNAFRARLVSYYYELLDAGMEIPRYVVRAHQHKYTKRDVDDRRSGKMTGYIIPSLQLKTHYATNVANMELSDHGFSWIIVDKDRSWMDTWRAPIPSRKPRIVEV